MVSPTENTPTLAHQPPVLAKSWVVPRSLYVHVPFCAKQCGYCDFAIAVGRADRIDTYLDAVRAELARLVPGGENEPMPMDTWFVGGGTPSLLSAEQLRRLGRELAIF